MRGEILSYDDNTGSGLISGEDGVRYTFERSALSQPRALRPGMRVEFVPLDRAATEIVVIAGEQPATARGVDWAKVFFSFNGRTRRSHFWIAWLVLVGVGILLGWIPVLGLLIFLATVWGHLANSAKRLHDMGLTGWIVAAPFGIWAFCLIVGMSLMGAGFLAAGSGPYDQGDDLAMLLTAGPAVLLFAFASLVNLAFLLWIGLTDSQPGENRFGPSPKGQ